MSIKSLSLIALLFCLALDCTTVLAETISPAMRQMATIMYRLKHFPSPQGKEELNALLKQPSTTDNERVLATAMLNLQHMADENDKPKLKLIMDDKNSSSAEKELAGIIYNLDHRPTDEDKEKLEKIMQ